jgi:hypothetical protein
VNLPARLLVAGALALAAGCGSASDDARVDRCVDRLLTGAASDPRSSDAARDYVRRTYCDRFERNGWVYHDGALAIDAQQWLDEGGECASGSEGMPTRTVPCDEVGGRADCALLRHVRRSEVRRYVAEREQPFACDDGTPIDELGVPEG